MAMKKSCLIVFLVILSLTIHDANAGWKFWKKDKDSESTTSISTSTSTSTSTTTTTTTTTISPLSTSKPSTRGSVNKGIANAADAGLAIGVGTTGNNIKNNAKPQQPNPGTEVGQDFPNSRPNRPGIGGADSKGYRDWAVDLTGAGEPVNIKPKAPGSPSVISPQQPPAPGARPSSPSNPNVSQNRPGSSTSIGSSSTLRPNTVTKGPTPPGNAPINSPNYPPITPTAGNGQKPPVAASPSPTGSKSWAEVAGNGGSRPGSPTPTSKSPENQPNGQIQPSQPKPTRPATPGIAIARAGAPDTQVYSSNPVYSKGNTVTDEDLIKLSEALFIKDNNNAWRHITLNLQKKTTSGSAIDESPQPLLTVNNAALQIPTIEKVLKIYDNYHLDTTEKEHISPLQRDEESLLVDTFLSTNVMSAAMRFLADKGYVKRDYYEYKYILRQIWFNLYSRGDGKIGSSGFEHVFMTELKFGTEVTGLHNWIYFNSEEVKKRADYLGYIKKLDLGDKAAILKLHAKFNGIDKPITSMFIGTSPELEMALYTVCFFARAEQSCPVQLGGSKFNIITHKFRYRGKDLIGSAYPEI